MLKIENSYYFYDANMYLRLKWNIGFLYSSLMMLSTV